VEPAVDIRTVEEVLVIEGRLQQKEAEHVPHGERR
jgi:hypothetical protein